MKTLEKIEKKSETWFLLIITFIFFLLRLPSLIEPLWYGDEAIYELIGIALNKGRLLYAQIWDNKPPLLYIIYALGRGDQFSVRIFSLCFGVLSVISFYYLSKKLFYSNKISTLTTCIYVFLLATPFIEGNIGNAENFMLLPIITAGLLVYKAAEMTKIIHKPSSSYKILNTKYLILFIAGFLLSVAFLFKIVALFDFAALFVYLFTTLSPQNLSLRHHLKAYKNLLKDFFTFTLGFFLPFLITVMYFISQGALLDFIHATFFGNIGYINYANKLIIPQGFLILKLFLLLSACGIIFWKRKIIAPQVTFIFLWFSFSLFSAVFSGRPWTHYLLVLAPSASLMIGLLFDSKVKKLRISAFTLLIILIYVSTTFFKINIRSFGRVWTYYQNFFLFVSSNKSLESYQEFFDRQVTRDYQIAEFITHKTTSSDDIFVWGNDPQIYVLSGKMPPGKYIVEYHISQNQNAMKETVEDIKRAKPKYIISLPEVRSFPFDTLGYINKFNLKGASFYEKTF